MAQPIASNLSSSENTVTIIFLKDFGAHRSCSDFDGILMRTTRGEACHWILGRLRLPMNPVPLPPLEMQQSCRGLLSRAQVGAFTAH